MARDAGRRWTTTTEIARFMGKPARRWDDHLEALFIRRDVDAAMADMAAVSSVRRAAHPLYARADVRADRQDELDQAWN